MGSLRSNQQGMTLIEVMVASALFLTVLLVASMAETRLSQARTAAVQNLAVTGRLQDGMAEILDDVSGAWSGAQGVPAVQLASATGCNQRALLHFGGRQVQWELSGGKLVRTLNGKSSSPIPGDFSDLCFRMDGNQATILVTLQVTRPDGQVRTLSSGATPEGGN